MKRYVDDVNAARGHDDAAQRVNRGLELLAQTAAILLAQLQVTPPPGASAVRQIYLAQELVKAEPDRVALFDMRRQPTPPAYMLPKLYRDAYWLKKAAAMPTLGALPEGAPYNDVDHLLRCLLNDAAQLLAACSPPVRKMPPYWQILHSGDYAPLRLKQPGDALAEAIWAATHEPELPGGWAPPTFAFNGDDLTDVMTSDDCESYVFSDDFRAAVEAGRLPQDNHVWLETAVELLDGRSRTCWLLNLGSPDGADNWGLVPELVAGRTVVLNGGGDHDPAWSDGARHRLAQACPQVHFESAHQQ